MDPNGPREVLPDVIQPGLKIVFCGTAPGTVSARRGAYYAHPQNRFWRVLHEVGLTPRLVAPESYADVLQWGLGLTDIAKQASGMDRELPSGALGKAACADLTRRIETAKPKILAFTSLTGGRRWLGAAASFGDSGRRIGETRVWVLPSPSPTAGWNWPKHAHWWERLAEAAND